MFRTIAKMKAGDERGFTLVELLVVVAIIAILAAMVIPRFKRYTETSARAAVQSDARNCVSLCAAEYARVGAAVSDCGCTDTKNSDCAGSVGGDGVMTVSCTGKGAYTGTCTYKADTGEVTCT